MTSRLTNDKKQRNKNKNTNIYILNEVHIEQIHIECLFGNFGFSADYFGLLLNFEYIVL